mgnify:FL=1
MSLSRYNPLGFESFFDRDPFFSNVLMPVVRDSNQNELWKHPGWEIHEDDKNYSVSIDVPGVKKDQMQIELEDNGRTLHLSGGRKLKTKNSISETKFSRRFTIGENVDLAKMSANLEDGVLTVTAPKKLPENAAPQTIQITEGPTPAVNAWDSYGA